MDILLANATYIKFPPDNKLSRCLEVGLLTDVFRNGDKFPFCIQDKRKDLEKLFFSIDQNHSPL